MGFIFGLLSICSDNFWRAFKIISVAPRLWTEFYFVIGDVRINYAAGLHIRRLDAGEKANYLESVHSQRQSIAEKGSSYFRVKEEVERK